MIYKPKIEFSKDYFFINPFVVICKIIYQNKNNAKGSNIMSSSNEKTVTNIEINPGGVIGLTATAVGLMLASKTYMTALAQSDPTNFAIGMTLALSALGASLLVGKAAVDEMTSTRKISRDDPEFDNYKPAKEHAKKGLSILGQAISKAFAAKTPEQKRAKIKEKWERERTDADIKYGHRNRDSWNNR